MRWPLPVRVAVIILCALGAWTLLWALVGLAVYSFNTVLDIL